MELTKLILGGCSDGIIKHTLVNYRAEWDKRLVRQRCIDASIIFEFSQNWVQRVSRRSAHNIVVYSIS